MLYLFIFKRFNKLRIYIHKYHLCVNLPGIIYFPLDNSPLPWHTPPPTHPNISQKLLFIFFALTLSYLEAIVNSPAFASKSENFSPLSTTFFKLSTKISLI